jgi:flagellar protein FliS
MKKGYDTYKEINTLGMSQLDLILTVYRGAINFLESARDEFASGNGPAGRHACERARRCIVHLYTTLDMEKGESIATHLGQLYAYMIERLDLAAAQRSGDLLAEIIRMMDTIKGAWESLKEAPPPSTDGKNPEHPVGKQDRIDTGSGQTPPVAEKRITISA